MKITIESDEKSKAGSSEPGLETASNIVVSKAMDGGAPLESLLQSTASQPLPEETPKKGTDGGTAPGWLVEAVQGQSASVEFDRSKALDGGSSPAI